MEGNSLNGISRSCIQLSIISKKREGGGKFLGMNTSEKSSRPREQRRNYLYRFNGELQLLPKNNMVKKKQIRESKTVLNYRPIKP